MGGLTVYVLTNFNLALSHGAQSTHSPTEHALEQTNTHSYLELFQLLKDSKLPNCMGYRVKVPSSMNIGAWEEHLHNYYDKQLIDFLKYGFPLDMVHKPNIDSNFVRNHPTATQFPDDIGKYIDKEIQHNAILGPFHKPPISRPSLLSHVNPPQTRGGISQGNH